MKQRVLDSTDRMLKRISPAASPTKVDLSLLIRRHEHEIPLEILLANHKDKTFKLKKKLKPILNK